MKAECINREDVQIVPVSIYCEGTKGSQKCQFLLIEQSTRSSQKMPNTYCYKVPEALIIAVKWWFLSYWNYFPLLSEIRPVSAWHLRHFPAPHQIRGSSPRILAQKSHSRGWESLHSRLGHLWSLGPKSSKLAAWAWKSGPKSEWVGYMGLEVRIQSPVSWPHGLGSPGTLAARIQRQ